MTALTLERKTQPDRTVHVGPVALTPPIDEGYWTYRVRLTDTQAVIGFPKFGMVGIGFAVEEDWNTNLPSGCSTEEIYQHIECNKGDDSITRERCIEAIRMIQDAVTADREAAR
jgi:hypothetical protein